VVLEGICTLKDLVVILNRTCAMEDLLWYWKKSVQEKA
jgi:hypothetical protein